MRFFSFNALVKHSSDVTDCGSESFLGSILSLGRSKTFPHFTVFTRSRRWTLSWSTWRSEAWGRSCESPYGIFSGQSGTGARFAPTSAFLVSVIPPMPRTHSFIYHRRNAISAVDSVVKRRTKKALINYTSSCPVSLRPIVVLTSHLRLTN
jgi:hypothetical protein